MQFSGTLARGVSGRLTIIQGSGVAFVSSRYRKTRVEHHFFFQALSFEQHAVLLMVRFYVLVGFRIYFRSCSLLSQERAASLYTRCVLRTMFSAGVLDIYHVSKLQRYVLYADQAQ